MKNNFIKLSFIRKLPNGKYRVVSKKGKNLGEYKTKEQAEKRLRQIEFFKHKKASKEFEIDLSHLKDLTYSAIMRELRKQCDIEVVYDFMNIYKSIFDTLLLNSEDNIAEKTLPVTIIVFSKLYSVEFTND